jgi:predicted GIY-YIG superfamily endonuclease
MKTSWIYVLHFDAPICHARHYSGSTDDLARRLADHIHGVAAKLTAEVRRRGITFRLGSLYVVHPGERPRQVERRMKNNNNGPKHCCICMPHGCHSINGARLASPEQHDAANILLTSIWDAYHAFEEDRSDPGFGNPSDEGTHPDDSASQYDDFDQPEYGD